MRTLGLSLKTSLTQELAKVSTDYFCLELNKHDSLQDMKEAFNLFKKTQIKLLDIRFKESDNTPKNSLLHLIEALSYLQNTNLEYLDLSGNGFNKVGIDGLKTLLITVPNTIKTLVLSANGWEKLHINAAEFMKIVQSHSSIEVKFEGTADFENQLTEISLSVTNNPNRLFKPAAKSPQTETSSNNNCTLF